MFQVLLPFVSTPAVPRYGCTQYVLNASTEHLIEGSARGWSLRRLVSLGTAVVCSLSCVLLANQVPADVTVLWFQQFVTCMQSHWHWGGHFASAGQQFE